MKRWHRWLLRTPTDGADLEVLSCRLVWALTTQWGYFTSTTLLPPLKGVGDFRRLQ